jgi:hypothetical protein
MKSIAILQSSYIPWKGYFDIINMVDEFVLFDDVQFTRRDWRTRNRIKTKQGTQWLTIPVHVKGAYHQRIRDVVAVDDKWRRVHWKSMRHSYSRAAHFGLYADAFEELYLGSGERRLTSINFSFLVALCKMLGIHTPLTYSWDYQLQSERSLRLASICEQAGATHYLSGPAAKAYLNEQVFAERQIEIEYMDYTGYPEYAESFPPFLHEVSVVDLLFNHGPDASRFMKSFHRDNTNREGR